MNTDCIYFILYSLPYIIVLSYIFTQHQWLSRRGDTGGSVNIDQGNFHCHAAMPLRGSKYWMQFYLMWTWSYSMEWAIGLGVTLWEEPSPRFGVTLWNELSHRFDVTLWDEPIGFVLLYGISPRGRYYGISLLTWCYSMESTLRLWWHSMQWDLCYSMG